MPRPEPILDLLVIARALILVLDQESDRRARGPALEYAGQDADRVGLLALTGVLRRSGAAPLHVGLKIRLGEREAGRASVHDAPERRPVALAETRHREDSSERISRHALTPPSNLHERADPPLAI